MNRMSLLPSDEAEPLNTSSSRASTEDIELRNDPYSATGFSSPSLAPPSYNSRGPRGSTAARTSTRMDSRQQTHHRMRHQNGKPPSQNPNRRSNSCFHRSWTWEVLSIAVAVIALVAIVITLFLHKERPLPKWPSAITINALIAVFTAIFKACLMMPIAECIGQLKWLWYQKPRALGNMEQWDLASRGPWGSLLLIFILKIRGLAVIGAILTIVAMAVDPFTQQVVQFYSCSTVIEGEVATVSFSNNYTNYNYADGVWADNSEQLDPQIQSEIYFGLLSPLLNTSAPVKFECRTGNCTFPSTDEGATFQSLALNSQCANISTQIAFSTREVLKSGYDDVWINVTDANLAQYNLSLTGGTTLSEALRTSLFQSGSKSSWDEDNWPSPFLNKVAYLMTRSDSDEITHLAEPNTTYAFECEFYPVVQTYSANIKNGVLLEQVLNTQRMDVWRTPYGGHQVLLLLDKTIREGKWHECTCGLGPSNEHNLPVNISVDHVSTGNGSMIATAFSPDELASPSNNITWWPQDCVYWLPYQIASLLSAIISNTLGYEDMSYTMSTASWKPWTIRIWNDGYPTEEAIQATMDGLTQAVTARLRQGDGVSVNAGPAIGTVWGVETCVHVNWVWITLPASLLLLTVVFLALTIVRTRSEHARVWKGSIFAVLFSGLDQETRKAHGPVASLEEMKAAADRATVRLEDTKDGFRLVSQT